MNNKSISFNQEFIPKILSGQKTQTRRPIKDILDIELDTVIYNSSTGRWDVGDAQAPSPYMHILSPYKVGDVLWVREPFCLGEDQNKKRYLIYQVDNPNRTDLKWVSAKSMPIWASRILLEITGIRVERLEDVTPEDCIAEGFTTNLRESEACSDLREQFLDKWEAIYPKSEPNPWVWVIEFKVKEIKK